MRGGTGERPAGTDYSRFYHKGANVKMSLSKCFYGLGSGWAESAIKVGSGAL